MVEQLITRFGWGRRSAEKLRATWMQDVRVEGDRLRDELRQTGADLAQLRRDHERLLQTLSELNESVADTAARQRRTSQFMLTLKLNEGQQDLVARLPTVLDAAEVAAHVRQSIAGAEMMTDPFPHMVVTEVVPSYTYKMMLRAIPPAEYFGDKDLTKQNLRIPANDAPELTKRVWRFVDDVSRDAIVPAVIARFGPALQRHYDTIFGEAFTARAAELPQAAAGGRVMLRRPGYHLAPHRDPKRAMLTCLMYLARPGDDESHGTQIFRVTGDQESSYAKTYYPEAAGASCELVKLVPYRPNSMLVFLNGTGAHGADIPADAPSDLERYSYQFYVGPGAEALESLVADLPDERRRMWQGRAEG